MRKSGISVNPHCTPKSVAKEKDGTYTLHFENGSVHGGFDCVVNATGRTPVTKRLNLEAPGVMTTASGHITVDEYQNTTAKGVYCLGDASDKYGI